MNKKQKIKSAPLNEFSASDGPVPERWMTEGLIQHTQDVWTRITGKPVNRDEAIEMMRDVARFGRLLMKIDWTIVEPNSRSET